MFSTWPQDRKRSVDYAPSDYPSTAPSTPDGSLTFSPLLEPSRLRDAFDISMAPGVLDFASLDLNATLSEGIKNICCIGAGYVGGPTSAVIALHNPHITVSVVDRDYNRIASWNSKHLPIHENGLDDVVRIARDGSRTVSIYNVPSDDARALSFSSEDSDEERDVVVVPARKPNLIFSTEVARCISIADIILVTVNTPTKLRGVGAGRATDVTALEAVTKEIALHARPGTILVEKSTVPCGTSELMRETLAIHRPGVPFEILSNPEFLAEGTAINDLLCPDRVVIGSANTSSGRRAAAALANIYSAWVPKSRITTVNVWSSELSKLVANAMLAQRISSINSISAICEQTGADVSEIALTIGLDQRIGPQYLRSGLGFGGSCFKKDILSLVYLAESLGLHEVADYWQQVVAINDFQRDRFTNRIIKKLNNTLVRKKITLLGYAFKKNTSDTRETPVLEVIRTLLADEPAEIAIFDPCCDPNVVKNEIQQHLGTSALKILKDEGGSVEVYADVYEACKDSNAVVVLTEWDEFRNALVLSKAEQARLIRSSQELPKVRPGKAIAVDPRPFQSLPPSETELLALHTYQRSTVSRAKFDSSVTSYGTLVSHEDAKDPVARYLPEPSCAASCRECHGTQGKFDKAGEQLDWSIVAQHMRSPKWVFDGRGILNHEGLERLGIKVESIGRL